MEYQLETSLECKEEIISHCKKNKVLEDAIRKKVNQIVHMPHHFKPLHKPLQNKRRVHIMNCFVLIYEIIEESKTVKLLKFSHHKDAY